MRYIAIALFLVACSDRDPDAGKQRPDTPESRRGFATMLAKDMGEPGSLWTEGARSEGLVMDMRDCTMRTLSEFAQQKKVAERLWQFDFTYVRCANGTRVDGPWAR